MAIEIWSFNCTTAWGLGRMDLHLAADGAGGRVHPGHQAFGGPCDEVEAVPPVGPQREPTSL